MCTFRPGWFMGVTEVKSEGVKTAVLVSPKMQESSPTCRLRLRYFLWDSGKQTVVLSKPSNRGALRSDNVTAPGTNVTSPQVKRTSAPLRSWHLSSGKTRKRPSCGGPKPPASEDGGRPPSFWAASPHPSRSIFTQTASRGGEEMLPWTSWSFWTALCPVSTPD